MNPFTKLILVLASAALAGILILTALPTYNYLQVGIGIGVGFVGFFAFGRGRMKKEKLKVAWDFGTIALMGVFFLSIIFGNLGGVITNSQASINIAQFLISFWLGGGFMAFISGVLAFKSEIGAALFSKQLRYIAGSFAMFFLTNLLVPPTVPLILRQSVLLTAQGNLSDSGRFVTVIIGIPEETTFRGWLAPWLGNISRTGTIGGTIGSAIIFMIFHAFIYGTTNLIIIFIDGLVQGFVALRTKTLLTTMFNHVTNNAISVGIISPLVGH